MDYSKFNPQDPKTRLRENVVFRVLERDKFNLLTDAQTRLTTGIIGAFPRSTEELNFLTKVVEQAEGGLKGLRRSLLPWIDWDIEENDKIDKADISKDMHKRWESVFGSLHDPAIQKKLDFYREKAKKLGRPSEH